MADLTAGQAAKRLGITRPAVSDAIRRGTLKARRVESPVVGTGWYWAIDEDEIERYRREHLRGRRDASSQDPTDLG